MRLYLCTDPDRQCLDVGVDPRFSCVCKKGYVEEDMVCVGEFHVLSVTVYYLLVRFLRQYLFVTVCYLLVRFLRQ